MPDQNKDNNLFKSIASQASISKVIGYYLGSSAVIRKGSSGRFVCKCPFHDDHDPSMQIDERKGTFHCFVDGHMGDSISFVSQYAKLKPLDALKKVCEICGLAIPESLKNATSYSSGIETRYGNEIAALADLETFYELSLKSKNGEIGRNYLKDRGIDDDIISHFHIGYAPEDAYLSIKSLRGRGHQVTTLQKAGILSNGSEMKDTYEKRIMFPITDRYGHVVAFSGRRIDKDQPGGKYINYRETDLFRKSNILYHYDIAKDSAPRAGYLYLVEGFMDAIAFVRAGIESVVGTMGTALTSDHIHMIAQLNVEVRLALDSDEAGQSSMERLLPLFREARIPVRVQRTFKNAKDADECLTKFGKEEFLSQVNSLYDPFLFLLGRYIRKGNDLNDNHAVLQFLSSARPYYSSLDSLTKEKDLSILSKQTGLSKDSLKDVLEKTSTKDKPSSKSAGDHNDERNWGEYPRRNNKKKTSEPFNPNCNGKENQEQIKKDLENLAIDYCEKNKLILHLKKPESAKPNSHVKQSGEMKELVRLEAFLILILSQSRTACQYFEDNGCVFLIPPLYTLNANFLQTTYLSNQNLQKITNDEYDLFLNQLKAKEEGKASTDGESPFDLTETEDEANESQGTYSLDSVSSKDREFLVEFVTHMKKITTNLYDAKNFEEDMKRDKNLIEIYSLFSTAEKQGWNDDMKIKYAERVNRLNKK